MAGDIQKSTKHPAVFYGGSDPSERGIAHASSAEEQAMLHAKELVRVRVTRMDGTETEETLVLADFVMELSDAFAVFLNQKTVVEAPLELGVSGRTPNAKLAKIIEETRALKPVYKTTEELFDGIEKARQKQSA